MQDLYNQMIGLQLTAYSKRLSPLLYGTKYDDFAVSRLP